MESEDRKPIFTRRLILTILVVILLVLIILLLLRKCGTNDDIQEIVQINVSPQTLSLEPKESRMLYATVNSTNTIYWTSSDEECVTIVPAEGNQPIVYAGDKECEATIIARTADNVTAEVYVKVVKGYDALEGLQLNKSNYIIYVGKTGLVSTTAVPTTAELPELEYVIDDTSIATVNENGVLTGVSVGETTLTVRAIDGSAMIKAKVTVKKKPSSSDGPSEPTFVSVSGLEFNSANAKEVCVGQQIALGYKIKPDNSTNKNVRWSVNNPTDNNGLVNEYSSINNGYLTGIKAGTTKVTIVSEDNSKLTATTTITVLASSSSKCKSSSGGSSGGGSSSSGSSTSTSSDGSKTSTNASGAMSCSVDYKQGKNGWYTKFNVTWAVQTANGMADSSYYDRKYCISDSCNSLPSSSYTYKATEADANKKFKYTYKSSTETATITKDCPVSSFTKLDNQAPTCEISATKNPGTGGSVTITASGNDNYNVNIIKINGTGGKVTNGSYSINDTIGIDAKTYSAYIEDEAGNYTICSKKIDSSGIATDIAYVESVVLRAPTSVLYEGKSVNVTAYFKMSDGKVQSANPGDFTYPEGYSISNCSGTTCTLTADNVNKSGTITLSLTAKGKGYLGKDEKASVSVKVAEKDIDFNVEMTGGCSGWCQSATIGTDFKTDVANLKPKSLLICATTDSSCTPNKTSLTLNKTGVYTVYYSINLGDQYGTYGPTRLGRVKIDNTKPSCQAYSSGIDGVYHVVISDDDSGLKDYMSGGSNNTTSFSIPQTSMTIRNLSANQQIIVTDVAGNQNSCNTNSAVKNLSLTLQMPTTLTLTPTRSGVGSKNCSVASAYDANGVYHPDLSSIQIVSGGSKAKCYNIETTEKSLCAYAISDPADPACSGSVTVRLKSDPNSRPVVVNISVVPYKDVIISASDVELSAGGAAKLGGLEPKTFASKKAKLNYSSDNENCVKVDSEGRVTDNSKNGGCSAKITITESAVYNLKKVITARVKEKTSYSCFVEFKVVNGTIYAQPNFNGNDSHVVEYETVGSAIVREPGTYAFKVRWDNGVANECSKAITQSQIEEYVGPAETATISIRKTGTNGWETFATSASGVIVVNGPEGATVSISCSNASCGAASNTISSSQTLQRRFSISNPSEATITVTVTKDGKTLISKTEKLKASYIDNVAPKCSFSITNYSSGTYATIISNVIENGSGVSSYESGWTKLSDLKYSKYITTGGPINFTVKDAVGNQYTCSGVVNKSASCSTDYKIDNSVDSSKCTKLAGSPGTEYGSWQLQSTTYVPSGTCASSVSNYTKTTCDTFTGGPTISLSKCGDTECQVKKIYTRSGSSTCSNYSGATLYSRMCYYTESIKYSYSVQ